ncbi:cell 12A endoglucanase [Phytophthora cinnamomi]|uniref:cell 12A endoglucanase n=1 Tax=Phytophthora cinnamomi TaxID=4785 RepID=UPI0035599825|nr:cell 12A endoglucanase [Phytophthora cinnamomi]
MVLEWERLEMKKVKSFANAALKFDHVPISSVTSIPSTIEYDFKYEGKVVANVTYDLFTTSTLGGDAEYEVMVWLAAIGGAGPLSNTGSAVAQVTVGGVDFNLCRGKNGNMTVYSYVATNTPTSFSADFKQCARATNLRSSYHQLDRWQWRVATANLKISLPPTARAG